MREDIELTSTEVAATTNVVKLFRLTPTIGVVRCTRLAIHDRIKEVQKALGAPGKPLSVAQLAAKANFPRQTLNQIVAKSRAGHESGFAVLSDCADKWGVSFEWLTKGRGEMRPRERDPLELAIESEPWDESAVLAVRAMAEAGKRFSVAEWARLLRVLHSAATAQPSRNSDAVSRLR